MGLFDFFKSNSSNQKNNNPSISLKDYKFLSDNHVRSQNGKPINVDNKGAWRGIWIKSSDNKTFYVTMYNMNGRHPIWGDNIQMTEKRMKMISETTDKIILRGFGTDIMGASFADYGLTLYKSNGQFNKVALHLYDRNIDIVYEKAEDENQKKIQSLNEYSDFDNFKNFAYKFNKMPMQNKMKIALQTDMINNKGANAYNNGDIQNAIKHFEYALKIMPINDDALINLAKSYTKVGKYGKCLELLKKLYYLNSNTKSKIIAYSLLMQLLENFGSDGGIVIPSTFIRFIKIKFDISTNDSEVKSIIQRINQPYNRDILIYMIDSFGMGRTENPYMTSDGTTKSVIRGEIKDVLDWN